MSIYESLEGFVGALVICAAPALDASLSQDQVADPSRFVQGLRQGPASQRLGAVLDHLAYDVWTSQEKHGFSMEMCEKHARALTEIISQLEGPHPLIHSAFAGATDESQSAGGEGLALAQTLADALLEGALKDTSFATGDIRYDVAAFLLERSIARLLDDRELLVTLLSLGVNNPSVSHSLPMPTGLRELPSLRTEPRESPTLRESPASAAQPPLREKGPTRPPAPPIKPVNLDADSAFLEKLGDRYGLTQKALSSIGSILAEQSLSHADRLARLEDFAAWMCATLEYLGKPTNDDPEVRRLKGLAASALAAGSFAEAMEHLKHLRREVREGRRRIETRLQEELRSLEAQMGEEAKAIARMAELAMARLDFDAAADLFSEAADSTPERDRKGRWRHLMRQGEALLRKGEDKKDPTSLRQALDIYHLARAIAADIANPNAVASAQLGYGTVHLLLAEGEAAGTHIDGAIEAFDAARSGFSRKEEPRRLAQASLRLGKALSRKGQLESEMAHYVRATSAYREALGLLSKADAPHDWASAQTGLGRALLVLADDETSATTLREAEKALAEALSVLVPAQRSEAWMQAATAHATALLELAESGSGDRDAPAKAIAAYELVLEHCDPAWQQQEWAEAKLGHANALAVAAARANMGTDGYLAAIDAYDAALEHIDANTDPLTWAITQINRGAVLIKLGEHRDKRRLWMAAAAAMVPALEIFERHGESHYIDIARRNLKRLHEQWDDLIGPLRATGSD